MCDWDGFLSDTNMEGAGVAPNIDKRMPRFPKKRNENKEISVKCNSTAASKKLIVCGEKLLKRKPFTLKDLFSRNCQLASSVDDSLCFIGRSKL